MNKENIKMFMRYVTLGYFMYLAYEITRADYAVGIKDVGEVAVSAIYGSVFGSLTFVIKSHFETKVEK
jgi:hypothetical protein